MIVRLTLCRVSCLLLDITDKCKRVQGLLADTFRVDLTVTVTVLIFTGTEVSGNSKNYREVLNCIRYIVVYNELNVSLVRCVSKNVNTVIIFNNDNVTHYG